MRTMKETEDAVRLVDTAGLILADGCTWSLSGERRAGGDYYQAEVIAGDHSWGQYGYGLTPLQALQEARSLAHTHYAAWFRQRAEEERAG